MLLLHNPDRPDRLDLIPGHLNRLNQRVITRDGVRRDHKRYWGYHLCLISCSHRQALHWHLPSLNPVTRIFLGRHRSNEANSERHWEGELPDRNLAMKPLRVIADRSYDLDAFFM